MLLVKPMDLTFLYYWGILLFVVVVFAIAGIAESTILRSSCGVQAASSRKFA